MMFRTMGGGAQISRVLELTPAEIWRLHAQHINPIFIEALELFGFGRRFVRASGIHLYDEDGREYLDFLAGYGAVSVGHNHPDIRGALEEVLKSEVPHFLLVAPQPLAAALAKRLTSMAPDGLDLCYLASSGSEAVEGALKLARLATRRPRFVSAEGSYHGTTVGALSVTGSERHRAPFDPLLAGCARVPWGSVEAIEQELRRRDVAAVILEPLQGEGGVRPAPSGFLSEVARVCRRYGTVFVLDEVQTGLCRCGHLFACNEEGVVPDALLLAKGLSGGLAPISALLVRSSLWKKAYGSLSRYDLHCSTFSGGPIACAAALATLEVIQREGLVARAAELGAYLGARLRGVAGDHPLVREVRGRGLFWGIDLKSPNGVAGDLIGQWLAVGLLERGVLTQVCSGATHVVRVQPPLVITRDGVDRFAQALRETLERHAKGALGSMAGALSRAARSTFARALEREKHL